MGTRSHFVLAALAVVTGPAADAQHIQLVRQPNAELRRLPMHAAGRVQGISAGSYLRQWPGTYFETAFTGANAFFRVGPGPVSLRLTVDGGSAIPLVRPIPGLYQVAGLVAGRHQVRIDVASESQDRPTAFGGFYAGARTLPAAISTRALAMEFIGDSHTVGYANTSTSRQCTEPEVWETTDTSRAVPAIIAKHYNADYGVNAISGKGVIRNYNGSAVDTLPEVYPYILFDKAQLAVGADWHPRAMIVSLGTNDFSTPLRRGEKWKTRDQLRADFETSYVRFARRLRAQNPNALIVLWAVDQGDHEVKAEVEKVVDQLRRSGDTRVGFLSVSELALSACNYHPSLSDDQKIADAITRYLDAHAGAWRN